MSAQRRTWHLPIVLATSRRIFRQLRHDPHTIAMAVAIPSALVVLVRYLLNSEDEFDATAPALVAVFPFSVMFLVTSIATLRERISGTLERLMTYTLARIDLLLGYVVAFGLVAAAQVILMLTISMTWLGMDVEGSVVVLFLVAVLNAVLGVALGLLASVIVRTEYQVVQLLPIVVLPQVMIGGLFAPRESMASALEDVSNVLPLPEAIEAVKYVANSGSDAGTTAEDVLFLAGYTVVALALGAASLRRQSRDGRNLVGILLSKVRSMLPTRPATAAASPGIAEHAAPTASWFELYQDEMGAFRFRLKNGQGVLAASAAFTTQEDAEDAIQALCRTVPTMGIDNVPERTPRQEPSTPRIEVGDRNHTRLPH